MCGHSGPSKTWIKVKNPKSGPNVCGLPLVLGGIWEDKCAIKKRRGGGPLCLTTLTRYLHCRGGKPGGGPRRGALEAEGGARGFLFLGGEPRQASTTARVAGRGREGLSP